jgi:predicted MFS family arabinose efflux permease
MEGHPNADVAGSAAKAAQNLEGSRLARDPNLHIVFAVTLVAVMGVSSLTPAFPAIARALDVSSRQVGLLISVFTVPGVILAPVLGVLADRWGRKRVLVPSLLLFALAGASCAFARDFQVLLGLRLLQGVGAGALSALNMTILSDLFTGHARTTAMGYNSSVLSVGTASYPAIGGALAGVAWYLPFFLPLAALPVAILVATRLKTPVPARQLGLRQHLAETLAAARDRRVISAFLAAMLAFIVIFGPYLTFLPILMDRRFAASSLTIGLLFSLGAISSAVASARLGQVARRFPVTRLVAFGFIAYAVVLSSIIVLPRPWMLTLPVVLFGMANGMAIPSLFTWLMGLVEDHQRAAILAMNGSVLRLGQTLGPLIGSALLVAGGLEAVFLGVALLTVGMAVYMSRAMR